MSSERQRVDSFGKLENGLRQASDWYLWGPYVSERQWGTVREDYSADGEAWDYLPHDHARSRAYRWGEDGLAGFCDIEQRLCLGLALWNGRDPILKERIFGLTGCPGQSRRRRQGVLVVSRRGAQPRLEPLALPLPAARVPVPGPDRRERPARQTRSGVRAARHRRIRRRSILGRRSRLRQGGSNRRADARSDHQRGSGSGDAARAAERVVPQHLVVGT